MDTTEFNRASQAIWDAMAPGWDARHAFFEENARPVTERMLERLEPTEGQTILDLAAGTGVVGFAAAPLVGSSGRVVVSDFAEAMVDVERRHAAELGLENVECRVLDAERLDLRDGAVDGVLCRWGYMLMPDPAAALRETRRVLAEGGRFACSVFGSAEQNPWAALLARVLREQGHMPPPQAGEPGILSLGDPDRLGNLLEEAGFGEPRIEEVEFVWPFDGADDYWVFVLEAVGAIAMVLGRLGDDERERVREQVFAELAPFSGDDGIKLPALSLVASAS
jgi:ubiquinone/menaquinone biosynthesis C-methylase UbiE